MEIRKGTRIATLGLSLSLLISGCTDEGSRDATPGPTASRELPGNITTPPAYRFAACAVEGARVLVKEPYMVGHDIAANCAFAEEVHGELTKANEGGEGVVVVDTDDNWSIPAGDIAPCVRFPIVRPSEEARTIYAYAGRTAGAVTVTTTQFEGPPDAEHNQTVRVTPQGDHFVADLMIDGSLHPDTPIAQRFDTYAACSPYMPSM